MSTSNLATFISFTVCIINHSSSYPNTVSRILQNAFRDKGPNPTTRRSSLWSRERHPQRPKRPLVLQNDSSSAKEDETE